MKDKRWREYDLVILWETDIYKKSKLTRTDGGVLEFLGFNLGSIIADAVAAVRMNSDLGTKQSAILLEGICFFPKCQFPVNRPMQLTQTHRDATVLRSVV